MIDDFNVTESFTETFMEKLVSLLLGPILLHSALRSA
ncbi:hypothetical protein CFAL_00540 [Corynebacterium falsenii DSM 44353]|nr:hypothetical protein CFAL_00540 [Corynebacterium falsenii DSM 44353]